MRAPLAAILLLWAATIPGHTQVGQVAGWPPNNVLLPSTYVGPGDLIAFTAWYGLRGYSAAVAATGLQKAVDLRRVSDNATCTALIATDGSLDLTVGTPCNIGTQTVTAWVGGSSARVSKMYDQTGGNACASASCDLVQATANAQPQLLLTGCGGSGTLPCLSSSNNSPQYLRASNNFTPGGSGSSFATLAECTWQFFVALAPLIKSGGGFSGSGAVNSIYCAAAPNFGISGTPGLFSVPTTNGLFSVVIAVDNLLRVDNIETGGGVAFTTTTASQPQAASNSQASTIVDTSTHFGEGGFQDNVNWSSGIRIALCHNMRLYWGTGGSC